MAHPYQKEIDNIDSLLEEPTDENIKGAIAELSKLAKHTPDDSTVITLKSDWIQYQKANLQGLDTKGMRNAVIVRFVDIYKEYKSVIDYSDDGNQDEHFKLLCNLNFTHQTNYFKALMNSDKRFISFVIRGPEAEYGQRWLANKLIQEARSVQKLHAPIGVDVVQLNLTYDTLIDHLCRAIGVEDNANFSVDDKRVRLKDKMRDLIGTKTQFIIFTNAFNFIHSPEYTAFFRLVNYFNEELNNKDLPCRCVFLFVEQQAFEAYQHVNDCFFSEHAGSFLKARQIHGFRFFDLGQTTPIRSCDVTDWMTMHCSDHYLEKMKAEQESEHEMKKLLGNGNPQQVIPQLCNKIGINYIEKEKIWLKY